MIVCESSQNDQHHEDPSGGDENENENEPSWDKNKNDLIIFDSLYEKKQNNNLIIHLNLQVMNRLS